MAEIIIMLRLLVLGMAIVVVASSWGYERPDLETFYVDENKKATLIFIHGSGLNADIYLPFAVDYRLRDKFNIVLYSLRGHGRSEFTRTYNPNVLAFDVLNLILGFKLKEVYLVGYGLGCRIAIEFAVRYGRQLDGMVCIDSDPNAYPASVTTAFADQFTALKALNLQRTKAQIKADIVAIVGEEIRADAYIASFTGKEGDYKWRVDFDGLIKNMVVLYSQAPLVPYKGKVRFIWTIVEGQDDSQEFQNSIRPYYPRMNMQTDLVVVVAGSHVYLTHHDLVVNTILTLVN